MKKKNGQSLETEFGNDDLVSYMLPALKTVS